MLSRCDATGVFDHHSVQRNIIDGLVWQCCYQILSWENMDHSPECSVWQFLFSCNHIHLASQQQKYALPVNRMNVNLIEGA